MIWENGIETCIISCKKRKKNKTYNDNGICFKYICVIWKDGNTFSQQPRETFSSNGFVTEESNSKLFGLLMKSSIVLL